MYVKRIQIRNYGPIVVKVIRALLADRSIGYTISEQPRSPLQQYCLTNVGRASIEQISDGNTDTKRKESVTRT